MSFHVEIELRRGLFYARLPLIELCWTKLQGWSYSRRTRKGA
jgi:hypothetical protein